MAGSGTRLNCLTLNVQGLRNPNVRKTLFRTFNKLKVDVICLQETYIIDSDLPTIEMEWKGTVHLSAT